MIFNIENKKTKFKYTNNLIILSNRLDIFTCYTFLVRDKKKKFWFECEWVRKNSTQGFVSRKSRLSLLIGNWLLNLQSWRIFIICNNFWPIQALNNSTIYWLQLLDWKEMKMKLSMQTTHQLMTLIKTGKSDEGPHVL